MSLNHLYADIEKPDVNIRAYTLKVDKGIIIPGLNPNLPVQTNSLGVLTTLAINLEDNTRVSGILPISSGGTNSNTTLSNGFLMESKGGQIVEGTSSSDPTFDNLMAANVIATNVLCTDLGSPTQFVSNAYITNAVISTTVDIKDPIVSLGVGNGAVGDTINEGITVEYKFLGAPGWSSILRSPNDNTFYFNSNSTVLPGPSTNLASLIRSDIAVGAITASGTITTQGDLITSGDLTVTGSTSVGQNITCVTGDLTIDTGTCTIAGNTILNSDLKIAGDTTLSHLLASRIIAVDASKIVDTINLDDWIAQGPNIDVTSDSAGGAIVGLSTTYPGQVTINIVGVLTIGTWNAVPIDGTYINYNTTNLKVVGNQLTTIQDISNVSSPTFAAIGCGLGIFTTPSVAQIYLNGKFGKYVKIYGGILSGSDPDFNINIPNPTGLSLSDADFVLTEMSQTINGSKTFSSTSTFSSVTNQIILGTTNTTTISSVAPSASRVYSIQDAGANTDFIMSAGTQTVSGSKTFSNASNYLTGISASKVLGLDSNNKFTTDVSNLTPTFTNIILGGVPQNGILVSSRPQTIIQLANGQIPIGRGTSTDPIAASITGTSNQIVVTNGSGSITLSTPQNINTGANVIFNTETLSATTNQIILGTTNTTTISSVAPSASRVYSIQDAGTSADFVMTAGSQTIGGAKTFSAASTFSSTVNINATTVSRPTSSSTNYGIDLLSSGSLVNNKVFRCGITGSTDGFTMTQDVSSVTFNVMGNATLGTNTSNQIVLNNASSLTANTTGGGVTLPLLAAGYLQITVNGTQVKVPYYAN
jgi:hypothetical protein